MTRKIRGRCAVLLAAALLLGTVGGCGKDQKTGSEEAQVDVQQTGADGQQTGADGQQTEADAQQTNAEGQQTDDPQDTERELRQDTEYDPAADGLEYAGPPASMQEKEKADTTSGQSADAAMGRYMERELAVPEGMSMFVAFGTLEDGALRVLGQSKALNSACVWDSRDSGASWETTYVLNEVMGAENTYCVSGAVEPDGSLFLCMPDPYAQAEEETMENYIYGKILPDGTWQQTDLAFPDDGSDDMMSGYLHKVICAEPGKIFVKKLTGADCIYLFDDTTGELLATYNQEDAYVDYFEKAGGAIYAFGTKDILAFDCATGEQRAEDAVLTEEIASDQRNLTVISSDTFPTVMCDGAQDGEVYYATRDGIFRYVSGGSVVEQVVDGNLSSLAKPSVMLYSLQSLQDGAFLLAVRDDSSIKFLRYLYDASAPTVPDTKLRIYSLNENKQIRQAVSMFQARNPHYYVNYEVGMSGQDAVTASDALRTLNTEIMAGSGPDILVLDGMPIQSYIERGILQDISDVVQEIKDTDGLYENITNAYETDGGLYAVPSRFKVPVVVGDPDILAQITSLTSLGETAQKLREEDPDIQEIVGFSNIYWTVRTYYEAYSAGLLKEDGSFDGEELENFIRQMKTLLELNHYSDEQAGAVYTTTLQEGEEGYDFTSILSMTNFFLGEEKIEQANLNSGFQLQNFLAAAEKIGPITYHTTPYMDGNVFVPCLVMGVSSQSAEQEGAKEFVRFLFSQSAQAENQSGGFPVNRAGMAEELGAAPTEAVSGTGFTYRKEDGTMVDVSYDVMGLSDEEKENFLNIVESLDTPALTDGVVEDLVTTQTAECLAGHLSVEDAVHAIEQKMNLYLQE